MGVKMSQSERNKAIFDNIGLQEGDSVLVIGCETGEIIDYCLNHNAKLVVGVDNNPLNVETVKERFLQMKNVEIAFWDSIIYSRWIEQFDLIISMVDLCDLNNPRQFVRDVSIIARKSARFTVVCKNEQSDNRISELLYSNFMITSRTSINENYIIKSIKLPKRR